MGKNITAYRKKLTDFTPDPKNANRGTERGQFMIVRSIEKLGAGRSLVSDANDVLPAGNKTQQALVDAGFDEAIVVETDGQTPVIVKRTDWDLSDPDPENPARQYAFADNRTAQMSIDFDPDIIADDLAAGLDLSDWWMDFELDELLSNDNLPEDWQEFDESASDDVEMCECPKCGHEFPK